MKIIDDAIRYPVTTAVGVILLILFGFISLARVPVQLTPSVDEPTITVTTRWPGASPREVEREIVDEQEEQLKSLEGLLRMESSSSQGTGSITLFFPIGTDIDSALLKVANRLEQVPEYPQEALKPVISSANANENAVAWFILMPRDEKSFDGDISTLYDFVDDYIKPEIERVEGVGQSNFFGGRQKELHVIVDPAKLASRLVTFNELAAALERENRNYSGGDFDEGKRRYIVRTVGEYRSPEEIENIIITVRDGVPIYLRDVGQAELGYRKPGARVFAMGEPVIAINAIREPGSNVLEVVEGVKSTVKRLNADLLEPKGLHMVLTYDVTQYINSAVWLVKQSIAIGGLLATFILLLYLRSRTSTLVIAVAIPISIIGTFTMLYVFGRTLNVVSLAGMAFAVGMVVDNSIVVLENIYRHRQMGKSGYTAAFDGAREVWGAVLASTLTTIAVFIPVVFMEEEAGQLFGDIALALCGAVALSLIVSITVIPSLSARILRIAEPTEKRGWQNLWGLLGSARDFTRWVGKTVHAITATTTRRLAVITGFTTASIALSILLMPPTEYLPVGNQNFLFGIMLPPPGYSLDEVSEMRKPYEEILRPFWKSEPGSPQAEAQPGGGIGGFFYVALNDRAFMGARANDATRARELIPEFYKASPSLPGAINIVNQASIFQRGFDEGRNIDIDVTGPDLEQIIALGGEIFGRTTEVLPGSRGRPIPGLDLDNPEVQVATHRRRAAELGLSNRELGYMVSALIDGAKASDYQYEGKEIDLKVMADHNAGHSVDLIEQYPIGTPDGRLVTLGSVAEISQVNGPIQINHRERERAITLRITPAEEMPLETAMSLIETEILRPMQADGRLGGLYRASLSGTADKLTQTAKTLRWNFLLAIMITYLLMAALFESFVYPFVIMFSVPLAALGGFLGLAVMNLFTRQPLDVLTMLGFIILVGTVVNNAILIVHQSLNHMRQDGLAPRDAIRESVENRIRPIFMSVMTSVFGMLPLVLWPGAGSELYRGLGSVVVGGLVVSTVFTLFLVPAMFSLMLDARGYLAERLTGILQPAERGAE